MTDTPRLKNGQFISRHCPRPECGYGLLQLDEPDVWCCDGLSDEGGLELEACRYTIFHGEVCR